MENTNITQEFMNRMIGEMKFHAEYYKKDKEPFEARTLSSIANYSYDHVDLWHGLWYQGEMACLFGEPNVGKSILAIQIANEIAARGLKTLYFDLENAAHQYKMRYKTPDTKNGNNNLIIKSLNYFCSTESLDSKSLLGYIKKEIVNEMAPVIVVDDITHLISSGDQADAHFVLNTLRSWSQHFLVSILVLAHSRRRRPSQLTTIESLAGSFEFSYAFDSIFSLTRVNEYNRQNNNISHFIKHHKNRMGPIVFNEINVVTALLGRDGDNGFLQFNELYTGGNERQLLRDNGYKVGVDINKAIIKYKKLHYSTREIAGILCCSQSHVSRVIRKYESQLENHSDTTTDTSTDPITTSAQQETSSISYPRIKLEPDLTPIFDASNYTRDPYGYLILNEDYKNNYIGDVNSASDDSKDGT